LGVLGWAEPVVDLAGHAMEWAGVKAACSRGRHVGEGLLFGEWVASYGWFLEL